MKRLSVWLSEETESEIIALAGGVGEKRSAWVRAAIDTAIDTARHPERITIVPADGTEGSPCAVDVAGLEVKISRLTDENLTLEQDLKEALQRASECDHLREQIRSIEEARRAAVLRADLGEKDRDLHVEVRRQLEMRVEELKASVAHYEGEYVRLTATLPERSGRPWWKIWGK